MGGGPGCPACPGRSRASAWRIPHCKSPTPGTHETFPHQTLGRFAASESAHRPGSESRIGQQRPFRLPREKRRLRRPECALAWRRCVRYVVPIPGWRHFAPDRWTPCHDQNLPTGPAACRRLGAPPRPNASDRFEALRHSWTKGRSRSSRRRVRIPLSHRQHPPRRNHRPR
jgi:hypothetical protein